MAAQRVGLLLLAGFTAGCPFQTYSTHVVETGVIGTPGVAIWDKDGAFRLEAGSSFTPPFYTDSCVHTATAQNFQLAREHGARPVVVQVPELSQPIYGLLTFCRVPDDAEGPATREYRIRVPTEYVEATDSGRVSVVYEPTTFHDFPAWQLWLSRSQLLWP